MKKVNELLNELNQKEISDKDFSTKALSFIKNSKNVKRVLDVKTTNNLVELSESEFELSIKNDENSFLRKTSSLPQYKNLIALAKSKDESGKVYAESVAYSVDFLVKIDEYLTECKLAFSKGLELPPLAISGEEGMGRRTLMTYINSELNDMRPFREDVEESDKEIQLVYTDSEVVFRDWISQKKKGIVYCLIMTARMATLDDGTTILANSELNLPNRYFGMFKFDKKTYHENSVAQDLIDFIAINCGLDGTNGIPQREEFAKKFIEIKPKTIHSLFMKAHEKARISGVSFNKEYFESYLSKEETVFKASKSAVITKPKKSLKDLTLTGQNKEIFDTILSKAHNLNKEAPQFIKNLRKTQRLVCLFSGEAGTGKSLSAEVLAYETGRELWTIDLGKLESKWVGESEKNITEIFELAQKGNVILRFDECDGLLNNRGEGSPYQRKVANHFLNILEEYEGIVVLTSNFVNFIDSAFKRRLDFQMKFSLPGIAEVETILKGLLMPDAPLTPNFNWNEALRGIKPMSGGFLRNAVERAWVNMSFEKRSAISEQDLNKALKAISEEGSFLQGEKKAIGFNH